MQNRSKKFEGSGFRVLFVCTANAYRSPICEALLRKLRPELIVDSAGTKIKKVCNRITSEARKFLAEEGALPYLKKKPESIDSKQVEDYDVIIVMEQEHKDAILKKHLGCVDKIVVWGVPDKIPFFCKRTQRINRQMKKSVFAYSESFV